MQQTLGSPRELFTIFNDVDEERKWKAVTLETLTGFPRRYSFFSPFSETHKLRRTLQNRKWIRAWHVITKESMESSCRWGLERYGRRRHKTVVEER